MSSEAMKAAIERAKANKATAPPPAPLPAPTPKKTKPPRRPEARDKAMAERGRLPDNSCFVSHYNATRKTWFGSLMVPKGEGFYKQVPGVPDEVLIPLFHHFDAEASGVFKLLTILDDQYRAWLAAQAKPAEEVKA